MPVNSGEIVVTDQDDKRAEAIRSKALAAYLELSIQFGHEIANPMTGIIVLSELLLTDHKSLSMSQIKSIKQIARCAEQIDQALEKLSEAKSAITKYDNLANEIQDMLGAIEQITTGD